MTEDILSVRLCEKPVGYLERRGAGMRFTYLPSAKRQLSLSMPITSKPYGNKHCEAFFGGLLPESAEARRIIGQLFRVKGSNSFNLIEAIGYDCAGAVSIQSKNEPILDSDIHKLEGTELSQKELAHYLKELKKRPLLAHLAQVRISLAGAQDKAALCLIEDQLCLPINGSPTTHIVKPPIPTLNDSVTNEYFCLRIAFSVGIPTAKVSIQRASDIPYLMVERYDRIFTDSHLIKRVHQEDFCQAKAIVSTKKYQVDGGPTLKDCFELLDNTTSPATARNQLIDLVVFNYLIGNADAHAKNFSFLYYENGQIKLAPAYDLMCTRIYPRTTAEMAMSIGGESVFDKIRLKHWQKFCQTNKVSFTGFRDNCINMIKELDNVLPEEIEHLEKLGFASSTVDDIVQCIESSSAALKYQLKI